MDTEGGHFLVSVSSSGMQEDDNIVVTGKLQLLSMQTLSGFGGKTRDDLPNVLCRSVRGMGGMGELCLQPLM
jgi:hypothetical protein